MKAFAKKPLIISAIIIFILLSILITVSFLYKKANKCFPIEINNSTVEKIEIVGVNDENYELNIIDKNLVISSLNKLYNNKSLDKDSDKFKSFADSGIWYRMYTKYGTIIIRCFNIKDYVVNIYWDGTKFPEFYEGEKKGLYNTGDLYASNVTNKLKYKNAKKLFEKYQKKAQKQQ